MLADAQESDFDLGPKSIGAGTERLCAVSRKVKPVSQMIRFVVGPDDTAVPDLKRKLPGRGIWITAERSALTEAIRRGAFGRGFGRPVKIPENLVELTERLLERSALDALAIAGKAGRIVTGSSNVEAALARLHAVAVIHASDAAPDGMRKIAGAARRRPEADKRNFRVISVFTSDQLSLALGRSNVIHAALLAGAGTETFVARCARLERFRADQSGAPERSDD